MISPGTGPPSAGSGVRSANQLERNARRALRRHRLRPLSGFAGKLGVGGGGVARHVAEPGVPEQVVPVGVGGEPGDHRDAEPVQVIGELVPLGAIDAGIDRINPSSPRTTMELVQAPLPLCRTQTPSATCVSIGSLYSGAPGARRVPLRVPLAYG